MPPARVVLAFGREWTVDVSPHPDEESVPLAWVEHLAHETPHEVFAVGDQRLVEEAGVPGVVDAVGRRGTWEATLGGRTRDGGFERFPDRRERLALLADLYPDERRIVVDDRDPDVDGWDHYTAWEFVPAVEAGDLPLSVPEESPPREVEPDSAAEVEAVLEAGDLFEVAVRDDGVRTHLATGLQRVDSRASTDGTATYHLELLDGGASVPVERIARVAAVDPGDRFAVDGDTPAERADQLRRYAGISPDLVDVADVLDCLSQESPAARRDALEALKAVVLERPGDALPTIPTLRRLLTRDRKAPVDDVLFCLAVLSDHSPADVAPSVPVVSEYVTDAAPENRLTSSRCLSNVAGGDPGAVLNALDDLAAGLDDSAVRESAVFALNHVAAEYPGEVERHADALVPLVADGELGDAVRANAISTLGQVAAAHPDAVLEGVDAAVAALNDDDDAVRANAVGLLADVAGAHPSVVEPHLPRVAVLLDDAAPKARANAASTVARVAESYPDSAREVESRLVDCLDDEFARTRRNACWGLGHLGAEAARERLERLAVEDPDEGVRERAAWAADAIDREV